MWLLASTRYLLALVPATLLVAVAIGIPTDVLPNPWFQRMTSVRALDVVLWPLISLSLGALLASYALPRRSVDRGVGGAGGGGLLGAFAVGCPICNKLVVMAIGTSGALSYFEPLQPVLGVAAVVIPALALRRRLRSLTLCHTVPSGLGAAEAEVASSRY